MCATCCWYALNRCISLADKARQSNFYTTPQRIVVRESFLHRTRLAYEGMIRGKRWTIIPLCHKSMRELSCLEGGGKLRGEKAAARRRRHPAKAGLRPQEMSA
jgi:hypothetical protein